MDFLKKEKQSKPNLDERTVNDYSNYREGDTDPSTGKKIEMLINAYDTHIVFLDPEYSVQWSVTSKYFEDGGEYPELFGLVSNQIAELESLTDTVDLTRSQLRAYRRLLGEAVSRMLDDEKDEVIKDGITRAEKFLRERMEESARVWYFKSASITAAIAFFLALIYTIVGSIYPTELIFGSNLVIDASMGALGAILSIFQRFQGHLVNPSAGKRIHVFEGSIRVIVGVVSALLVAVVLQSKIIQINVNDKQNETMAILAFCLVAGASERMVSGLITRVESVVGNQAKHGEKKGSKKNTPAEDKNSETDTKNNKNNSPNT